MEFEEVWSMPCDVHTSSVSAALQRLGWSSEDRPILHVHPGHFAAARGIATSLGWACDVRAEPLITSWDEWFVTYRGRSVGSQGA